MLQLVMHCILYIVYCLGREMDTETVRIVCIKSQITLCLINLKKLFSVPGTLNLKATPWS